MATYRSIAASETDPDSPVTSTLMVSLAENPTAIAEGSTDAPKLAIKTFSDSVAAGNVDITNLDDFSGIRLDIHFANSSGASTRDIDMSFSDDGVIFGTPVTLRTVSTTGTGSISMAADFATGDYEGAFDDGATVGQVTGTVTGSSLSVVTVRITAATDVTIGVFAQPNGGESAS